MIKIKNDIKKILVVEDEIPYLKILNRELTERGYKVIEAANGEKGLEQAKLENPDLILLDIKMPKMDGMTMLKKLREDVWGKNVPIIVLSNDDNPEHISETLKDNAFDYLIKADWKLDDIVKKIKETLRL